MTGSRFEKNRILTFDERVDPSSTALVIIDVQNDFALPQGVCGQIGDDISPVAPMVARLKTLIEAAREAGVLIVFVRTIYDEVVLSPSLAEQYLRRGYPNSICLTGTPGAEFYGGIGPRENAPNEILVTKHRYSAFWGSPIDFVLRRNGIRTVVLTGIATEVCVESTARDAFFRDYQVVVPEDCVGCYSEERQKAALVVIARSFGVVASSPEIAAVWQRLGNGPRNWHPESRSRRVLKTLELQLQPLHTAVVLVGMQSDLFSDDSAQPNLALRRMLPAAKDLLANARQLGCLIVHTRSAGPYEEESEIGPFVNGLEPQRDEPIVTCHRSSAFADTQLDVLLRSNCIRTVVIAGATTNGAVETTVREASDKDYHVVVARDAVATFDLDTELHTASLTNMARYFGAVISAAEIAAHWRAAPLVRPENVVAGVP
jgi:ureidoacrylate peracid hydrolase